MTLPPEQQSFVHSPSQTLVLPPWLCYHPLSVLSTFILTLLLILSVASAPALTESGDIFHRKMALPYPYSFVRTSDIPPSESTSKLQLKNIKQSQRKTLFSKSSPTVHSLSPHSTNSEKILIIKDYRSHTEANNMATELTPVTNHSFRKRLLLSSDTSDVLEGTKYVTPQSGFIKNVNYLKRQDKANDLPILISVKDDDSRFINDRTPLSSRITLKPDYVSSQFVSSETFTISSLYHSLTSNPSVGVNSDPYYSAMQSSEFEQSNPCYSLEDLLCENSDESATQVAESNSPPGSDLGATDASDFSFSGVSPMPSIIMSLPETQSEKRFEHVTSLGFVEISKLFDGERTHSSNMSVVSDFLPKSSVLSTPKGHSHTLSFGNATLDSVNAFETLSFNTSRSEDLTYWTYKHKNSSDNTSLTLTEMKSFSLESAKTRKTSNISSALAQRSISSANNSSDHLKRITVLGLFEMTTRAGERTEGRSEMAAARLAVSHINEKNLLPGYQLELITNDTKVTGVFSFNLYNSEIDFCDL